MGERFLPLDSVGRICDAHNNSMTACQIEPLAHGTQTRYFFIDPNGWYREVYRVYKTDVTTVRGKTVGGVRQSSSFFGARIKFPHKGLYQASELTRLLDPTMQVDQLFIVLPNGQD